MNWTTIFKQLNTDLADFYPTTADMLRLARQANIRTSFIRWDNQSLNDWFNILEEADKQKKLFDLLAVIKEDGRITDAIDNIISEVSQKSRNRIMNTFSFVNQTETFIQNTKELIVANKLEDAVRILRGFVSSISNELENTTIHFSADLINLRKHQKEGTETQEYFEVQRRKIRSRMLSFIDDLPEVIRLQEIVNHLGSSQVQQVEKFIIVSNNLNLERIISSKNHMEKTCWFLNGHLASRSVCRILIGGRSDGTGFLLRGGYLMTNYHVLNSKIKISNAEIEFNYEEGQNQTTKYRLDVADIRFSSESKLDYCLVKVIDNPKSPIKQWGYLELETQVEPRVGDPVNIIQHPWGEVKRTTFRANNITSISGDKVFYLADTDEGSSGSPVFNQDWKVIALHSRGGDEKDESIKVSLEGTLKTPNQGFLITSICKGLGLA
jgi:V8-like Glu-specific endopeptidase